MVNRHKRNTEPDPLSPEEYRLLWNCLVHHHACLRRGKWNATTERQLAQLDHLIPKVLALSVIHEEV